MHDVRQVCNAFLTNVEDHKMTVIKNDNHYRHLRFRNPVLTVAGFDVVTWPGNTLIESDHGTYVFKRSINTLRGQRINDGARLVGYWEEMLSASCTLSTLKTFDFELFSDAVWRQYDEYCASKVMTPEAKRVLHEDIDIEILSNSDKERCYRAVEDFRNRYVFHNFFKDLDDHSYNYHFIWSVLALSYVIDKYFQLKSR